MLTAIQPYSGWRNSATSGEVEALDMVAQELGRFAALQAGGLSLERQQFDVYMSTEIWDSRLVLEINGESVEVPAEGLRGSRYDRRLAAYFDTDSALVDTTRDPVSAAGTPLVVREADALYTLSAGELQNRVLFLDFSLLDTYVTGDARLNGQQVVSLVDQGLAGVVLVTQYSNEAGESRGTVVGDGSYFQYQVPGKRVPFLFTRIEDLGRAGVATWEELEGITEARLTLDADVLCPGKSGSLIAHIPGVDSSRAVILGAHIDSPNGPGAFDDGSGSAALLEVARVLDASQIRPAVDLYLAWFGGHEIGIYGSAYFASTHQELLDRALAVVIMDGLGYPLDGRPSAISFGVSAYDRFGDERLPLVDFLSQAVSGQGISTGSFVEYGLIADNSNFDAFNVPNVYMGYMNVREMAMRGSGYIHYSNHWHDPYETTALAAEIGDVLADMTRVLLAAALETGRSAADFRIPPAPQRTALVVGSHTASASVPTVFLRDLGMALAWEGFDVDLLPLGQALTREDLQDASVVILPPTLDYPARTDGAWSEAEFALLDEYVRDGGLLVVLNSASNFAMSRSLDERNDDARALNALLEPMGVKFNYGVIQGEKIALAVAEHPLTENASYLTFYEGNAVPFTLQSGLELVRVAGRPVVGLVDYGDRGGQALVIGDIGLLMCDSSAAKNLDFVKNIARYARSR